MPIIPPWLHGPNAGEEYARGLATGAQAAEAAARLEEADRRAQQTFQMHRDQLQHQTALENARLATAQAYHQQEADIQRQRLAETAKMNAMRTQAAAQKLAATQKFNELAPKIGARDAMFQTGLGTPGLTAQMDRAQTIDQQREFNRQLRERTLTLEEGREKRLAEGQKPSIQALKAAYDTVDDPVEKARIGREISVRAGGRAFNYTVPGAQPAKPAAAAAPAAPTVPFKEGALIRSKKDGKLYRIQGGTPVAVYDQSTEREGD